MSSKTLRSKTFTASLSADPQTAFAWIADAANLPRWYAPLSRTPDVRFVCDDSKRLLDLVVPLKGAELTVAIRILPNGDGSEIVVTLVQPKGLEDSVFIEQSRWAGSAVAILDKKQSHSQPTAAPVESVTSEETLPSPAAELNGKKLYVGNLPYAWTEEPLRELFAAHGTIVNVAIPRLRGRLGRSKGYGFVEMSTEEEAQVAIQKLHDTLAGDRKIIVRLARAESKRDGAASVDTSEAPAKRPETPRARRPSRPPRARPAPTRSSSPRKPTARPSRDSSISNSDGYEIYPRDSKGGFSTEPTPNSSASRPQAPKGNSPYFDDNSGYDSRGPRRPRSRS